MPLSAVRFGTAGRPLDLAGLSGGRMGLIKFHRSSGISRNPLRLLFLLAIGWSSMTHRYSHRHPSAADKRVLGRTLRASNKTSFCSGVLIDDKGQCYF